MMDCHFVRDVVSRKLTSTLFTPSEELADMFTKLVSPRVFSYLCKVEHDRYLRSSISGSVLVT